MTFPGLDFLSNVMHDVRSLPSFPLRNCGVWCTKHKYCIYNRL